MLSVPGAPVIDPTAQRADQASLRVSGKDQKTEYTFFAPAFSKVMTRKIEPSVP